MDLVDNKKENYCLQTENQKEMKCGCWGKKDSSGLRNREKERIKSTKVVKVFTVGKFIVIHCD